MGKIEVMKTLLVLMAMAVAAIAQQTPIVDVATGSRCVASFAPATAATEVVIECSHAAKTILTTRLNISAITGNAAGFATSFSSAGDSITMLLKRPAATSPLRIEAVVNGGAPVTKDVPVP